MLPTATEGGSETQALALAHSNNKSNVGMRVAGDDILETRTGGNEGLTRAEGRAMGEGQTVRWCRVPICRADASFYFLQPRGPRPADGARTGRVLIRTNNCR